MVEIGAPHEVLTSAGLSRLYGAPVEVLRDSRGRVAVIGIEESGMHDHEHDNHG
jgi:zinc/manganese transport system ATP-binding protein